MARCIYRASEINRVEFWRKARWLRGLSRVIFGLLGDFRAGTLRNSMFRKSPEHNCIKMFRAITKIAMRDTAHVCMSNNLHVSWFKIM